MSRSQPFSFGTRTQAYGGFFLTLVLGIALLLTLFLGGLKLVEKLWPGPKVDTSKSTVEQLSDFLQTLGLLAASLFFTYKLFTGWLIINMSISIQTTRQKVSAGDDLLVVTVNLNKGSTDTLWLTAVECQVLPIGKPHPRGSMPKRKSLLGKRPRYQTTQSTVHWHRPRSNRGLTLSPGEQTSFAGMFTVVPTYAYQVEVVVLGTRPLWWPGSVGQWRAVAVALPVPPKTA